MITCSRLPFVRHATNPGERYVKGFKKRTWLLLGTVVITLALGIMLVLLAREAIVCASLGDWRATRSYTLTAVVFLAGLVFFWWGYAGVRVSRALLLACETEDGSVVAKMFEHVTLTPAAPQLMRRPLGGSDRP
jgi:hypothetical protein